MVQEYLPGFEFLRDEFPSYKVSTIETVERDYIINTNYPRYAREHIMYKDSKQIDEHSVEIIVVSIDREDE